ncbi:MAG: siderophore ABC transporter substrate-binding protein [Rhodobacteraceae bacterium]|nr:siderophore ABC transporter substrate-binding protein [Paracoccaceae bacterium]
MLFSSLRRAGPLVAILAATSPVLADDVTIETATGPVAVAALPETLVVLDIGAIDTLDALGVTIAGVPTPLYVSYLDHVGAQATIVGSLFEPDFEALVNLNPDLIIAGGRSSTQVEPLSEIAQTVDMTIWGDNHIDQVLARLAAYGALTGNVEVAQELTDAFNAKLETARAAIDGKGAALIVLTNGPNVSAYGAGSRFGWLHGALNLPEAVEGVDAQTHGEAISFEFIAEANPDWLLVVDRGAAIGADGESAAQTLNNALVTGTNAWQNDHVIYLHAANIYIAGGGIQSMNATLDQLIAAFGDPS